MHPRKSSQTQTLLVGTPTIIFVRPQRARILCGRPRRDPTSAVSNGGKSTTHCQMQQLRLSHFSASSVARCLDDQAVCEFHEPHDGDPSEGRCCRDAQKDTAVHDTPDHQKVAEVRVALIPAYDYTCVQKKREILDRKMKICSIAPLLAVTMYSSYKARTLFRLFVKRPLRHFFLALSSSFSFSTTMTTK